MFSRAPHGSGWLLGCVIVAASLHAVTVALVRPMFQVSDEIGYFVPMQQFAHRLASGSPAVQERIMPQGRPFYDAPGRKPAFEYLAGSVFAAASQTHGSADAALLTRVAISVCHVATVVATWCLVRRLVPERLDLAFVASMLVSWQPVLASVNAGITPDAFANAFSAWAMYFVAVGLTRGGSSTALLVATLLACAAVAFKNTAFSAFAAIAVAAFAHFWQRRTRRVAAIAATLAVLTVSAIAAATIRSGYVDDALARAGATQQDSPVAYRVARLVGQNAAPGFVTFWAAFGNFGASEMFVSSAWIGGIVLLGVGAASGWLRRPVAAIHTVRPAVWWSFGTGISASILIHPLREVLLLGTDQFQGRWMFPMMAPIALILTIGLGRAVSGQRAVAAAGTFVATALGVLPLALLIVPHYYLSFPDTYNVANLYMQGVYGRGADAQRAMTFVMPVSPTLVTARAALLVSTLLAAGASVFIGAKWRPRVASGDEGPPVRQ